MRQHRLRPWLIGTVIVAAIGVALSLDAATPPAVATTPSASAEGQPMPSLAPMLQRVTPAVVNISTLKHVASRDPYFDNPQVRQFFGLPSTPHEQVEHSLGSGVIIDAAKGYVLTNNHVVGGADSISVTLQDGRTFKGKRIGADPATDVAVVQIPAEHLQALKLADSSKLRVGDYVVAVGDPFGLGQTVTSGIVSALGRSGLGGSGYQNFIQTDASINPGNSGGALVNLRGELVGINTMIFSPSGGNVGIGFAIPSNLTSEVMTQLLAHGKVQRGSLGVQTQTITPRIAQLLGRKDTNGVVITGVEADSAAEHAGLRPGDVLTAINNKPLHDANELRNVEGLLPLGSAVQLSVWRDGHMSAMTATLRAEKLASIDGGTLDPRLTGVRFTELSQNQRSQGAAGVSISAVAANSHAAHAGLRVDDVIIGVGNQRITGLRMLRGLAGVEPRQLVLLVSNAAGTRYVEVD
ncbi:MAG: Do family serine endopeptidase [Rhodanobacter sp.]